MTDERITTTLTLPKKDAGAALTGIEKVRDTHEEEAKRAELASGHAVEDRLYQDGRELSDEEYLRSLEFDGGLNNIMPKPPEIPGYDTMWGSTMNEQDLRNRLDNLGYTFVKIEECPHYRNHTARSATIPGVVSFNELVALKQKKGRSQMLARKFHHDAPLNSEKAIKKKVSDLMDYEGKRIGINMEDGTQSLGQAPAKNPTFSV